MSARTDSVGTVRVCVEFGILTVYVKAEPEKWCAFYLDPSNGASLSPGRRFCHPVAEQGRVVFQPG